MISQMHVGSWETFEYIVDTVAELASLTANAPAHSRAIVIHGESKRGEVYIKDAAGSWKKIGADDQ